MSSVFRPKLTDKTNVFVPGKYAGVFFTHRSKQTLKDLSQVSRFLPPGQADFPAASARGFTFLGNIRQQSFIKFYFHSQNKCDVYATIAS